MNIVLPIGDIIIDNEIDVISDTEIPTKTYNLDFENSRCHGTIDGLKAMEQAIFKILSTNRFEHLIYSDDYGFEPLFGREKLFVQIDLPRRIEEALLQDERITSVDDIELTFEGDAVTARFTCQTLFGDVEVLREAGSYV